MTTATDSKALIEKWRAMAKDHRRNADVFGDGPTRDVLVHKVVVSHQFSAATLEACANELEALSSSASSETPRFPYTIRGVDGVPGLICQDVESVIREAERLVQVCAEHYARILELEAQLASSERQDERPDLSEIARSLKRKAAAQSSPVPHEAKKDGEQ